MKPWEEGERKREAYLRQNLIKPFVEVKRLTFNTAARRCNSCPEITDIVYEISVGTTTHGPPNYFSVTLCMICRHRWASDYEAAIRNAHSLNT